MNTLLVDFTQRLVNPSGEESSVQIVLNEIGSLGFDKIGWLKGSAIGTVKAQPSKTLLSVRIAILWASLLVPHGGVIHSAVRSATAICMDAAVLI
jgi:hypothetical protein